MEIEQSRGNAFSPVLFCTSKVEILMEKPLGFPKVTNVEKKLDRIYIQSVFSVQCSKPSSHW